MFILKNLNIEAKRSKLMLNCESSEAKRTCWIVKKHVYIEELKYRSEANMFVSSKIYFVAKRTCLYLTLIRMTKDEKVLAIFKGLLL